MISSTPETFSATIDSSSTAENLLPTNPESETSILEEAPATKFDPFLDDNMSSLPPIPTYSRELGVQQDEFIDACRTHHEIHTQEKLFCYYEWDLVLTLGAYT